MFRLRKKGNTFYWGKRKIGKIVDNKFITFRNKFHFMKKYIGFGMNAELIDWLIKINVKEVVIIYNRENEAQEVYRASPKWIKEYGIYDKYKYFEPQYFLPITLWGK